MAFETLRYIKEPDGIAHVVLDRPDKLNAYNIRMRDEIEQALSAIRDDRDVRVVVLSGAGERAFCVGADLTEFGTAPSQVIARQVRWERDVWGLWLSIPKPFIAAMHGFVIGSGIEMALLCDLRLASEDATFALPEVSLGMVPAAGATQTLPRLVGPAHGMDLLLTGRRATAQEALAMCLVHQVVPRRDLLPATEGLAKEMAQRDSRMLEAVKRTIQRGLDLPLEEALRLERRQAVRLVTGGAT